MGTSIPAKPQTPNHKTANPKPQNRNPRNTKTTKPQTPNNMLRSSNNKTAKFLTANVKGETPHSHGNEHPQTPNGESCSGGSSVCGYGGLWSNSLWFVVWAFVVLRFWLSLAKSGFEVSPKCDAFRNSVETTNPDLARLSQDRKTTNGQTTNHKLTNLARAAKPQMVETTNSDLARRSQT